MSIHRLNERTLWILLADHLNPALVRLDGELTDLRAARDGANKSAARDAEKRFDTVKKARDELQTFMASVEQCADCGPLPTDANCPARDQNAPYVPDLDDGVMINSAALMAAARATMEGSQEVVEGVVGNQGRRITIGRASRCAIGRAAWTTNARKSLARRLPRLLLAISSGARMGLGDWRLQNEIGETFRIEEAPSIVPAGTIWATKAIALTVMLIYGTVPRKP